jgi:uncharacterized membrane protein
MNKQISRYLKQVKALLPVYGKRERAFIAELSASIEEYMESSPAADIQQVRAHFGEPPKVVSDYFSEADSDYLASQIKRVRHIRGIIFALIVLMILAIGIRMGLYYKVYLDAKESYLSIEETVIDKTY